MTDNTINNIIVAICGAAAPTIMALAVLRQSRKNSVKVAETHKAVVEEAKELKAIVNGPLGTSLAATAMAQEEVARLSPSNPEKLRAAQIAREASDRHNQIARDAEHLKTRSTQEKDAIIADYLARQGLPKETQDKLKSLYREL